MIRASACAADHFSVSYFLLTRVLHIKVLLPGGPEMARMIIVASALSCAEQMLLIAVVLSGEKDLLLELVRLRLRRCFKPMCCIRPRICAADIDLHLIRALDVRRK